MAPHGRVPIALRAGLAVAILAVMTACGGTSGSVKGAATGSAKVTVPGADRFAPFSTFVSPGTLVTFHNGDADEHTVVSVPGDPVAWKLTLAPGQSLTVAVNLTGTHRFFCSIHAHFDPATGQIAANANADHPNEPMEGVVTVSTS
jgi:plastocyanin